MLSCERCVYAISCCVYVLPCVLFHVVCVVVTESAGLRLPNRVQHRDDKGKKNDQNNSGNSNPASSPLEPWEDPAVVYISAKLADLNRPVGPNEGLPALRALRGNSLLSLERTRQYYHNHYASPLYVDTNNNRSVFRQYEVFPPKPSDKDGYDRDGYDRHGYDRHGYDRQGFDRQGYDREGYDRRGYNRQGLDRAEFNKWLKASRPQK